MSDQIDKVPSNEPGAFYVTTNCIDCHLCYETAPATFRRDDDLGFSRVYRQPETAAEIELAREAIDGCPVEAIGEDTDYAQP